jgi:CRP/FNR family transcriptional regulator
MPLAETLRYVTLFAGLDEATREAVARLAVERRAGAGQVLFRQDQKADGFYLVLDGKVKVYKLSPDGRQQILHVFGPGQAFAEAAMFAGGAFPAFAETLAESRLAFFPRDRFLKELGSNAALASGLIVSLARLCHDLATLVEQLALQDVAGRLARYVVDLAKRRGVPLKDGGQVRLDLPKGELARRLGTAPETLSRALARLAQLDLVAVDGRTITLRSAAPLAALAGVLPTDEA